MKEKPKFTILYTEEAMSFLQSLDSKVQDKIAFNINKCRFYTDKELFKKLENSEIWELVRGKSTLSSMYRMMSL